jgi:hypothetical protein
MAVGMVAPLDQALAQTVDQAVVDSLAVLVDQAIHHLHRHLKAIMEVAVLEFLMPLMGAVGAVGQRKLE